MAFDVNNFIIDRPMRGSMVSPSTGDILWSINQIEDPSLKCSSTEEEAVDALGAPIMIFDRAKKAEFTASNTILDLGLAAAQFGSAKKIASETNKIISPKFEEFIVTDAQKEITLSQIPVGVDGAEIKQIYAVNPNKALGKKYVVGTIASATEFVLAAATKKITLPTGIVAGTKILVRYDYETTSAVEVDNNATDFPTAGKFIMDVKGHDTCAPDIAYIAHVVMPNAKLKSDVDLSFNTKGKHPFSLSCMQNYCDESNRLFSIIIPEA